MRIAILLVLALATQWTLSRAQIEEEDGVLVLNEANAQEALDTYGPLLVEFYAPWCGHCKNLAPIYVDTAARLMEETVPIRIAKVDATENRELMGKFGVRGFPTLKMVRGLDEAAAAAAKTYSGPRGATHIADFVLDNIGSRPAQVDTAGDAVTLVETNRVLVAAVASDVAGPDVTAFKSATTGIAGVAAAYSSDNVFAAYGEFADGDVFVLKTVDGVTSASTFKGSVGDRAALREFVASFIDKYSPEQGVLVLDDENFNDAVSEFHTLLVEFYAPWCGHCKKLAPQYAAAAAELATSEAVDLRVAKVDATKAVDLAKEFGVSGYPTLKFVCGGATAARSFEGARTTESIVEYVQANSFAASASVETVASAQAFVDASEVAVVGFFATEEESLKFRHAVACIPGISVAVSSSSDVASALGGSLPGVAVLKKFRDGKEYLSGTDFSRATVLEFVQTHSTKFPEDEGVLVLGEDTLEDALDEYGSLLLEFYAPWCGHCKALAPEYVKAAAALAQRNPPMRIAKVDATEHGTLAAAYGVAGYPTLKLARAGVDAADATKFDGARTAADIERWVVKKTGSVPQEISDSDDFVAFLASEATLAIGFFDSLGADNKAAAVFRTATSGILRAGSGLTSNTELQEEFGASEGDIVVLKTGEDGAVKETYSGDAMDAAAIRSFVSSFVDEIPLDGSVLVLEDDNFEAATAKYPSLLVEFYAPWCGHCKQLAPEYQAAAKELRADGLRIAKVDATASPGLAKQFEVKSYPTLKFVCQGKVSDFTASRTSDGITSFVRDRSSADVTQVESAAAAKALADSSTVTVMGYFNDVDDESARAFSAAVACVEDVAIGVTTSATVAKGYGVTEAPAVWVVNAFRTAPLLFRGTVGDAAALGAFVESGSKKFAEDQGVLVLDEENFDAAVTEYGTVLAEFYAPWCGHCKKLAPEYIKAAAALQDMDNPIRIAKIDATENAELAKRFDVGGYPTLKMVRASGEVVDFAGSRTGDGIAAWMKKRIGSRPVEVNDIGISELLGSASFVALGFFADSESPEARAFVQGASGHKGVEAAFTFDTTIFARFGVPADASSHVVVFKSTDDGPSRHDFEGELTDAAGLSDFFAGLVDKFPADGGVLVLDDDNFDDAVAEFGSLLVEFYAPWCGHCKQLAPKYAEAARTLLDNDPPLRIAKVDATENPTAAGKFDVKGYPTLKFVCNGNVVDFDGNRDAEGIVGFVKSHSFREPSVVSSVEELTSLRAADAVVLAAFKDLEASDAREFLRATACSSDVIFVTSSAAVARAAKVRMGTLAVLQNFAKPPTVATFDGDLSDGAAISAFISRSAQKFPEEDDVIVLTDDIFEDALAEYGTMLVEFYAPWCGHCKKLAPEYAKAAKTLKAEDIHIAKLDATANRETAGRFEVKGYPTVKLLRSKPGSDPVEFGGQRTADGIAKWVRQAMGSRPSLLPTGDSVARHLAGDDAVIVLGVFETERDAALQTFKRAASGHARLSAGYALGNAAGAVGDAAVGDVVVYKADSETGGDPVRTVYKGDASDGDALEAFIAGHVDKFYYDDSVLVLEDGNFRDAVEQWGNMLVEFYAPWCGHCKQLAPKYVEAAKELKAYDPSLVIAKVDATAQKVIGNEFDVTSFPTLKFVCGAASRAYSDARETADIVSFVKANSYAPVTSVASGTDLAALQDAADVVAVAFVAEEDGEEALSFRKAVACNHEVKFGVSTSAALASAAGVSAPGIAVYRSFDPKGTRTYSESLTDIPSVSAFVYEASRRFPEDDGVIVLGEDNFDEAVNEYGSLLVEFYAPWCGHCKQLAPEYAKAAKSLASEVPPYRLAKVDATAHPALAKRFDVSGYPTLKMARASGSPVPFSGERTSAGLIAWAQKKSGSFAQVTADAAETSAVVDAGKALAAVGFFSDITSREAKAFRAAAAGHKHYKVAVTASAAAMEEFEAQADSVVVYKGDETFTYGGSLRDVMAMGAFLESHIDTFVTARGVVVLDEDNFDQGVSEFGPLLVKFYAPWCKACMQMEEQYGEAAAILGESGIRIAQIDADGNSKFKDRFGIESYPTLRMVCGGGASGATFDGDDMNTTQIVDFVREHSTSGAPDLDAEALAATTKKAVTSVVGFFADGDSAAAQTFLRATACIDHMTFAISTDPAAAAANKVSAPAIVLKKRWGTKRDVYTGDFSRGGDVAEFILANGREFPEEQSVLVLDESNFDAAVDRQGFMLVEFYAPWCGHCKKLAPEYANAAETLRGQKPARRIAKVDATANRNLMSKYGVKGFPTLKIVRTDDVEVKYTGKRTAEDIVSFVNDNAPKGFDAWILRSKGEARTKVRNGRAHGEL